MHIYSLLIRKLGEGFSIELNERENEFALADRCSPEGHSAVNYVAYVNILLSVLAHRDGIHFFLIV